MRKADINAPLRLIGDQYTCIFKRQTSNGKWRTVYAIGNTGVGEEIADFLKRLGHKVEIQIIGVPE